MIYTLLSKDPTKPIKIVKLTQITNGGSWQFTQFSSYSLREIAEAKALLMICYGYINVLGC